MEPTGTACEIFELLLRKPAVSKASTTPKDSLIEGSGQLRMAQGSNCMECVRWCSKLITACACVNQLYIKGCCHYITLALELPRKQADWMRSKFMLFIDF